MACRTCHSALGLLSRRTAPSLRPALFITRHTAPVRRLATAPPTKSHPDAVTPPPPTTAKATPAKKLSIARVVSAQKLRPGGGIVAAYSIYNGTDRLCQLICAQADYTIDQAARRSGALKHTEEGEELGSGDSIWHNAFGLPPTFSTWAHVSMLHMYLIVARLRACEEATYKEWHKQLLDHFFHAAEAKMGVAHELTSSSIRQRYLKDLFVQWRGLLLAYDEGLVKGDAVLASAVWRNLYKGREDVDVVALAGVVGFMRRCLKDLDSLPDDDFLPFLASIGIDTEAKGLFAAIAGEELRGVDTPVPTTP
ncbi:hypothetical protein OQA88_335 [Cercophora sp. LCS_1]